jgi:hypothetical protein
MKKITITIAMVITGITSYSQEVIPQKLVYRDSTVYFYAQLDSIITIQLNKAKKETYIYINKRPTDTIRYGLGNEISLYDKTRKDIIFGGTNYYKLSLETGKIDTLLVGNENERYDAAIGNLLIGHTDKIDTAIDNFIISYDMITKEKKVLCAINEDEYSIWGIDVSVSNALLICFGNIQEGKTIYYSFDLKSNTAVKKNYSAYMSLYDLYDFEFSHDDISGKYIIYGKFWLDTIFNVVQPTLQRKSRIERGFKVKNTDNYYYLKSRIDESLRKNGSEEVWLACRFTLSFDMCLYKIYNNELLTKNEIEKFDEWELHKLKNMVFAKHGYKFKSHYLQAFYHLFAFYQGKYADVNQLLTPIDKKNLELIQQISKTKEK